MAGEAVGAGTAVPPGGRVGANAGAGRGDDPAHTRRGAGAGRVAGDRDGDAPADGELRGVPGEPDQAQAETVSWRYGSCDQPPWHDERQFIAGGMPPMIPGDDRPGEGCER